VGGAPQVFEPTPQSNLGYPGVPKGRPRPAWDPDFDEILKAGAAAGPSKLRRAIERIKKLDLRLSEQQIQKRTGELKLTRWKEPWTQDEKDFLLERAREFSVADIARELGRTQRAVYLQLWRSRMSARFQDGYTQYELAQALHVSPFRIRKWIRLGWLTLYECRFKDRALVRFLESHSDEIDAARLDKDFLLWLRSLGLREGGVHSRMWSMTRKHSLKEHVCGRCGRKVRGNSFHRHLKRCRTKIPESRKNFL
jgi:hypothetical protein